MAFFFYHANRRRGATIRSSKSAFNQFGFPRLFPAYNLNNHPRSILAAHLLGERVVGAGDQGPLSKRLPPWVDYLRFVARERGPNRIHLADAFCGVCSVKPPAVLPSIQANTFELSSDIAKIVNDSSLVRIGIVVGAGDADRRVPLVTWRRLIEACVDHIPNSMCLLIGGAGEREAALALEDQLPPHYLSRLFNCVGRTTLPQLARIFNCCQWVVGSDTGPLHLGVACGARAVGWYFSRARVHETGPYGVGHYVWQQREGTISGHLGEPRLNQDQGHSRSWPVMETVQLMLGDHVDESSSEWELWTSHRDAWGMFYTSHKTPDTGIFQRQEIWERLGDMSSHTHKISIPYDTVSG